MSKYLSECEYINNHTYVAMNIQGSIFIAGNKYLFFSWLMYVGHSKIFEYFSQHLRMVVRICVCAHKICVHIGLQFRF